MARPLRIEYPGAAYHVMKRGEGRRRIFLGRRDYHGFLDLLEEISKRWSFRIYAFSLMPNHYHILLATPLGGPGPCR